MTGARARADWLAIWILWSAWCTLCGWTLSALGHLDRVGYAVAIPLFALGIFLTRRSWTQPDRRPLFLFRRSTFRRLAPKLWLLIVLISLIEGLCYHGDNYDYLTYRIPRLLHWWWAHHWYWINSTNLRMNFSATGFEWLMAPLFVVFQTDRPFFFINLVSYIMLPGLVFSVFRALGVKPRVAWWWMWVAPAGLCYALEAGGLGNDMFACVYLMAALHYGMKSRAGAAIPMALSILSIALLSNAKASNIPLGLPWVALVAFSWRKFPRDLRGWGVVTGALIIGLLVSAAVIMALNYHFTGDYAGDPTDWERMKVHAPLLGFLGTGIMFVISNFAPPFLPHDVTWNLLPAGLKHAMALEFPRYLPRSPGLMLEESCSFGIGASFFLLLAVLYGLRAAALGAKSRVPVATKWIAAALVVAWLTFMCKLASDGAPRLVTPYYLLTAGVVVALLPLDSRLTHRPIWRGLAYFTLLIAVVVVAATPGRPVLPPRVVVGALQALHAPAAVAGSWEKNQSLRVTHYDFLHDLRSAIPTTEKRVGLIEGDDIPGVCLWLPFGSREVVEFNMKHDSVTTAQQQGIHYVVVHGEFLARHQGISIQQFIQQWPGTIVAQQYLLLRTNEMERWYLVRLF